CSSSWTRPARVRWLSSAASTAGIPRPRRWSACPGPRCGRRRSCSRPAATRTPSSWTIPPGCSTRARRARRTRITAWTAPCCSWGGNENVALPSRLRRGDGARVRRRCAGPAARREVGPGDAATGRRGHRAGARPRPPRRAARGQGARRRGQAGARAAHRQRGGAAVRASRGRPRSARSERDARRGPGRRRGPGHRSTGQRAAGASRCRPRRVARRAARRVDAARLSRRRRGPRRRDRPRPAAPRRAAVAAHRPGRSGAAGHRAGDGARNGTGCASTRHPGRAPAQRRRVHHHHRRGQAAPVNWPSRSSPRPPLAACLLVALGALRAPRHAAAQHRATLDFGLARISQADIVDEAALTFAYYLESRYSRLTFASSGIGSLATGGQSAAQGGVGAFWLLPRSPLGIPELSASLSAARFQDGEGATARSVALRQIWGGVRHGVWLGGRTGDVLSQGNRFGTHSIEAGSWIVGRGVELSATLSTTWTRTATWHFDPIGQQSVITVPVRYADAAVRARLERPRFELEVSGTARRGILN